MVPAIWPLTIWLLSLFMQRPAAASLRSANKNNSSEDILQTVTRTVRRCFTVLSTSNFKPDSHRQANWSSFQAVKGQRHESSSLDATPICLTKTLVMAGSNLPFASDEQEARSRHSLPLPAPINSALLSGLFGWVKQRFSAMLEHTVKTGLERNDMTTSSTRPCDAMPAHYLCSVRYLCSRHRKSSAHFHNSCVQNISRYYQRLRTNVTGVQKLIQILFSMMLRLGAKFVFIFFEMAQSHVMSANKRNVSNGEKTKGLSKNWKSRKDVEECRFRLTPLQWRSQPKNCVDQKVWGVKIFYFRLATTFCLEYRFSKHKMPKYFKHFGGDHGLISLLPWLRLCSLATTVLATRMAQSFLLNKTISNEKLFI